MRIFTFWDVEEAKAYSREGGQALHLHSIIVNWDRAPNCFKAAVNKGQPIAHLFDMDKGRLVRTARKLGVRAIFIDLEDEGERQHIDLCGGPLFKAIKMSENPDAYKPEDYRRDAEDTDRPTRAPESQGRLSF